MCHYSFNPYLKENIDFEHADFSFFKKKGADTFHQSISGYSPTPLIQLIGLPQQLGIGEIYVKDEAHRFGIKSFKALGASYAIYQFLKDKWQEKYSQPFDEISFQSPEVMEKLGQFTFCAATDGNHGRAVAWTAHKLQQKAVIYMPSNTALPRIESIKHEGAQVKLIDGTFDLCVKTCAREASREGWIAISDTAYPGNMEIPRNIILGYTTLFNEIDNSLKDVIDFDYIMLPAGVGALAAAGASFFIEKYAKNRPKLICVEPNSSDCFLESIKNGHGKAIATRGDQTSIMAGLNCGQPSLAAWPIMRDHIDLFLSIPDRYVIEAMRQYREENVISGESGAAGLAALNALLKDNQLKAAREKLAIRPDAKVLLINTEGDTDPLNYKKIIGNI